MNQCKIGPRLLLITNRKSHTRFPLVQKSGMLKMRDMKMRDWKMRHRPAGFCRGWKMRDWKMWHKNTGLENAGMEKAGKEKYGKPSVK